MYLFLYIFSDFIAASVDIFIFVRSFQVVFPLKKCHKFSNIYLYCVLIPFLFLSIKNYRYTLFSMGLLIGGIIYITFTAAIYYFAPWRHIFTFCSLYWIMIYLVDGMGFYVLNIITGNRELVLAITQDYSLARSIYMVVMKSFFIIVYNFGKRNLSVKVKDRMQFYYKHLLFASAVGAAGLIYFKRVFIDGAAGQLLVDGIVFICTVIFMIISFCLYNKLASIKEQERLILRRKEMLVENYNCYISRQAELNLLSHEMKHHLQVIYMMLKNNDYEHAKSYIEKIQMEAATFEHNVYSGNDMIDRILDYKIAEAQKKGIEVINKIEFISKICIEDREMCVIISNLFENAIEACDKIDKGRKRSKWIEVVVKKRNNLFLIELRNSIQQIPGKKNHGMGLQIVNRIVEKYNGCMVFDYDMEQFNICITLFVG